MIARTRSIHPLRLTPEATGLSVDQPRASYHHKYYLNNKEKIKEATKRYYRQNEDKLKEYRKQYYAQNATEYKRYMKQYTAENQQKLAEYRQQHRQQKQEYMKRYNEEHRDSLLKKMYNDRNSERAKEQWVERKEEAWTILKRNKEHIRDTLERELNISCIDNWYAVTAAQIRKTTPGRETLKSYFTMKELLVILYPNDKWVDGRFKLAPKSTWTSTEKTKDFLNYVKSTLGIEKNSDWYRVSNVQLSKLGGGGLLSAFGKLSIALKFAFPEVEWESFSIKGKRSTQWLLVSLLEKLFPKGTIIVEDYLHPEIGWGKSHKLQLDVWLPEKNLAFEYQGEQHYHNMSLAFGSSGDLVSYVARDFQKQAKCRKLGIEYKKYTETRAQASLAMSFEITDKQYEFPDVSGCKKVLALGLGGGCDVLSASVLSRSQAFLPFTQHCKVVCADTKEENPSCTGLLPSVQCGGKSLLFLRVLPNADVVKPADVPTEMKSFALAMTLAKGALNSPWIVVLPETDSSLLRAELLLCNFDLIIGVDAGGDSLVDAATSGMEGRDKRVLEILKQTGIPFIHIVLGFGCDGEATEAEILATVKKEDDKGNYRGCFSLTPMFDLLRAQAKGLGHSRTPNIICNAIEGKKLDRRKGDRVVVQRGKKPVIPLEWLKHGFVFVYQ